MKRKGFTLIELLVVIGIIALLVSILMPALSRAKELAKRTVCSSNQKGIGTASGIYMNENGGKAMKVWKINGSNAASGFGAGKYNANASLADQKRWVNVNFYAAAPETKVQTAGSCLYLLVRFADVTPESFICPSSGDVEQTMQDAITTAATIPLVIDDWTDCIDFASGQSLSYSYNDPWNRPLDDTSGAAYVLAADKNPAYDNDVFGLNDAVAGPLDSGDVASNPSPKDWSLGGAPADWDWSETRLATADPIQSGNSLNHSRELQMAVYADGHVKSSVNPCMGLSEDNIYTFQMLPYTTATTIRNLYIGSWATTGSYTSHRSGTISTEDTFVGN